MVQTSSQRHTSVGFIRSAPHCKILQNAHCHLLTISKCMIISSFNSAPLISGLDECSTPPMRVSRLAESTCNTGPMITNTKSSKWLVCCVCACVLQLGPCAHVTPRSTALVHRMPLLNPNPVHDWWECTNGRWVQCR